MQGIEVLAISSLKVLERYGKQGFLLDNTGKCLIPRFNNLKNKYLSYYNEEDAYDLMVSAWQNVFLVNGDKNFKNFNGVHPSSGEEMPLVTYIYLVMRNAIINESVGKARRLSKETQVTGIEGESQESTMDRVSATSSKTKCFRGADEEIEDLQGFIDFLRAQVGNLKEKGKDRAIKVLEKKIEKLKEKIEKKSKVSFIPEFLDEDINFSDEEEAQFSDLLEKVLKSMGSSTEQCVVLALLGGVSIEEIALFFETEPKSLLELVQSKVKQYAWDRDMELDSSMTDIILSYEKLGVKLKRGSVGTMNHISKGIRRSIKVGLADSNLKAKILREIYGEFNEFEI